MAAMSFEGDELELHIRKRFAAQSSGNLDLHVGWKFWQSDERTWQHEVGRPTMTRWGWSRHLALTWCWVGPLVPLAWLWVVLLRLVAAPRMAAKVGLSEDEWVDRALATAAFGILNKLLLLDTLKVFALVLTSPALAGTLLARIRNEKLRMIARMVLTCIYTPLAQIL